MNEPTQATATNRRVRTYEATARVMLDQLKQAARDYAHATSGPQERTAGLVAGARLRLAAKGWVQAEALAEEASR